MATFSSRFPLLRHPSPTLCILHVLRQRPWRHSTSIGHGNLVRTRSLGLHLTGQMKIPGKDLSNNSLAQRPKINLTDLARPFSTSCSVNSRYARRSPKWPQKTSKVSEREEEIISEDEGLQDFLSTRISQERSEELVNNFEKDPGLEGTYIIGNSHTQRSATTKRTSGQSTHMTSSTSHQRFPSEDEMPSQSFKEQDGTSSIRGKGVIKPRFGKSEKQKREFESGPPRYNEKSEELDESVSSDLLDMETPRQRRKSMTQGWRKHQHDDDGNRPHFQKKTRDHLTAAPGHDVLYGISPRLLALQHARREVHQLYVTSSFQKSERSEVKEILSLVDERGLKMWHTNRRVLDKFSEQRPHQGVCMETSRLYFTPLDDNEEDRCLDLPTSSVRLILDQIKDPMNLGALLRSAYFLGIDKLIVSKKNCCSLTPVVSKASSGVMEIMPVYTKPHIPAYLEMERKKGWNIVGASIDSCSSSVDITPCHKYNQSGPVILVVGNEGFGLSSDIKKECSEFISIPAGRQLHAGIDSLNVSVATGILLHSLMGRK